MSTKIISLLLIVALFSGANVSAQKKGRQMTIYTTLGLKAGLGINTLSNSTINNDVDVANTNSGFGYLYGAKLGVNYIGTRPKNMIIGVHSDVLLNPYKRNYANINLNGVPAYSKKLSYSMINYYFYLRYTNVPKRFFIDFGGCYYTFRSVNAKASNLPSGSESSFINSGLETNYIADKGIMFGGGVYIKRMLVSLRYEHSLGSLTAGGKHAMLDGIYEDVSLNPDYTTAYQSVAPTTYGAVMISIEAYIPFIAFGRASCGGQGISFFKKVDTGYYWGRKGNWYD